jgi:hypothetical protein
MGFMPLIALKNTIFRSIPKTVVTFFVFLFAQAMVLYPAYHLEHDGLNTVQALFWGTHIFLILNTAILIQILSSHTLAHT